MKSLVKEVSNIVKGKSEPTLDRIDDLGGDLYIKIVKTNCFNVVMYLIFLILTAGFLNKDDNLSFISADLYFTILSAFCCVGIIISIIFFTLYIYSKKKEKQISLSNLKNTYRFYQIFDLFSFVSVFVTIFFWIILFMVSPVEVSGQSMENTYHDGDKILVWHMNYEPFKNDVVIINGQTYYGNTEFVIKRVVAVSGDKVTYQDTKIDGDNGLVDGGMILVNGEVVALGANITLKSYQTALTNKQTGETYYEDGIVPEGFTVVFGDNTAKSEDSKMVGLISNEDILGVSIFRIYPFNKIGIPTR